MSTLARRLNRPEFMFRPRATLRRLSLGRRGFNDPQAFDSAELPWSQTIDLIPDEMGRSVAASGIFDVCGTEAVYRLLDQGGIVADVGANVGYFTNLIATAIGPRGKVISFEPQPEVFAMLERNVARWDSDASSAATEAHRIALSSERGSGYLTVSSSAAHTGLAALREPTEARGREDVEVELDCLDNLMGDRELQLLKVDVEGHEHSVLEGAARLLGEHRIRDIVFEDQEIYPTPAMQLLEEHGMTLFTLDHTLLGPIAHPVREGPAPAGWPGPNYLATFEPDRALARLRPRGWRSLGLTLRRRA